MCEKSENAEQLSIVAIEIAPEEVEAAPQPRRVTFCSRVIAFCITNDFLILVVLAICLAKAYPPLGAKYVQPKITATWIAIMIIFRT
jgi:hypothetical protein